MPSCHPHLSQAPAHWRAASHEHLSVEGSVMPAAANTRGPSCLSATETLSFAWRLAWHGRRCASSRVTSSPRGPWTTRGGGSAAYSAECAPPAAESLCQRTFRGFRPLVLRPNSNRPTRGLRDNRCPCTTCSQNTPASPWLTPQPPAATPLRHAPRRVALGDRGGGEQPRGAREQPSCSLRPRIVTSC